jgi:RNA polymerase sigma-70 factor (ECF subfamily)
MPDRNESKTSSTLLGRLAMFPPDQEAWNEFVDRYGPRVLGWCSAWGLQEADALDVSQSVLATLSVRLRRFDYDRSRSFRGYLRTVVKRALGAAMPARAQHIASGGSAAWLRVTSAPARDDLVRRLEEEFDIELFEAATRLVRERVDPQTWHAYELTACEGRPTSEVASLLDMKVATVYQAKSRVMRMLQQEVRQLEEIHRPGCPD